MENTKNKNSFLITCTMCIVLLLVMCYFGVNTSFKGTSAISASDYVCGDSSKKVITREGYAYCCPTKYTTVTYADGNWYCTSGDDFNIYSVNGGWSCTGYIMQPMGTLDKFIKENYGKDVNASAYIETLTASDMYENIWWSSYTLDGYYRMGNKAEEAVKKYVSDIMEYNYTGYALAKYKKDWGNVSGWIWDYEGETGLTGSGSRDSLYLPDEHFSSVTKTDAGKGQYVVYYHPVVAPLKSEDGGTCFVKTTTAYNASDEACFLKPDGEYKVATYKIGLNSEGWELKSSISNEDCEAKNNKLISYDANGNNVTGMPSGATVKINNDYTIPDTKPTRVGYEFNAWTTDGTGAYGNIYQPGQTIKIESSLTLFALWLPNTTEYLIGYDLVHNDAENCPDDQIKKYDETVYLSSTIPTLDGYTFVSWNTSSKGTGTTYKPEDPYSENHNLLLYAIWKENDSSGGDIGGDTETKEFIATFYDDDNKSNKLGTASCIGTTSCKLSEKDVPKPPTKSGYTFKGWHDDSSTTTYQSNQLTLSKTAVNYYAVWEEDNSGGNTGGDTGGDTGENTETKEFIATFEGNGGEVNGSTSASCSTQGTSCTITGLPDAIRDGYIFNGWSSSTNCTSVSKDRLTLSKNTTFYACYSSDTANEDDNNNDNADDKDNGNITDPPVTGEIAIALTWFIGLVAIGYAMYYFKTVKEN